MLLGVFLRLKQYDKTLWGKYTQNETKTGGKYGKYFHSYSELPRGADISWNKCDPYCTEYQHAEGYQLGFIKIIR